MLLAALCVVLLSVCNPPSGLAQDLITTVDPDSGQRNQFRGQVLAWDQQQLTYVTGGRERQIPSRRVAGVVYPRNPRHVEAERLFESGRFDQAALALENAAREESRPWVVEEMRARRLQCALAVGQLNVAIAEFLEILRASPQTRYFHLIPLAWNIRERVEGPLAGELQRLLQQEDQATALIAASWLLMTDDTAATDRLRQLAISEDSRIAMLANAQRWRPRVIAATADDLRGWQATIERMPEPLQAGPRYLSAVVQQRLQGDSAAVIALLQIPILFPEQYQLAGDSLLRASQLLQRLGREEESARVARELLDRYANSAAAQALQNPVETIDP